MRCLLKMYLCPSSSFEVFSDAVVVVVVVNAFTVVGGIVAIIGGDGAAFVATALLHKACICLYQVVR